MKPSAPSTLTLLSFFLLPIAGIIASYVVTLPSSAHSYYPPITGREVVQFLQSRPDLRQTMRTYDRVIALADATSDAPFVETLTEEFRYVAPTAAQVVPAASPNITPKITLPVASADALQLPPVVASPAPPITDPTAEASAQP